MGWLRRRSLVVVLSQGSYLLVISIVSALVTLSLFPTSYSFIFLILLFGVFNLFIASTSAFGGPNVDDYATPIPWLFPSPSSRLGLPFRALLRTSDPTPFPLSRINPTFFFFTADGSLVRFPSRLYVVSLRM